MKKFFTSAALLLVCVFAGAQNIQLHYDFGSALYDKDYGTRPVLTSTVEKFAPDKWGSTFFFIDMDYTAEGITGGYWELARELSFWQGPLSIHAEYNGGLSVGGAFQNAYLGGLTYTYNSADFSKGYSLSAMYKHIQKNDKPHNFQLTGVWHMDFGRDALYSFSGFADFWSEKTAVGDFIFLAEPQFWVNLNKLKSVDDKFNLSVGTEVELNNDFGWKDGFHAIPTLAIKWTFN
ncbi:hypothetical protein Barb6XT_02664 [Bacteroidales bacterium Barb6XT]|nr:hypothetical protein Barb6XT_02664 [Bacteroidales bacterium Barb6XT]